MRKIKPLNYKLLKRQLSPASLGFKTTNEIKKVVDVVGQQRALTAIDFGIGIKSLGYNFYVMGPTGLGKRSLVRAILKKYAETQSPPDDWCYIYNFDNPEKPIALKLANGTGLALQKEMDRFVSELRIIILTIFESDEYRRGIIEINKKFNSKRKNSRKPINPHHKIAHCYREKHEAELLLLSNLCKASLEPLITRLKLKFNSFPKIITYLDAVRKDVLLHVNDFIRQEEEPTHILQFDQENPLLIHYQVNLLVNNANRKGLPVIIEENPTVANLMARIEHKTQYGTLTTDFTLIRAGALHRANGGFLIIDARKIKKIKHAWDSLKNALYTKKITIEPMEPSTNLANTVSIKPKAIPLKVKVVLVGDRNFYYKLSRIDPDFNELFKVAVDFDDFVDRDKKNITTYSQFIAATIKKRHLRPFAASAIAAIIEHSSRIAEDVKKLTTHVRRIEDLAQEADYWARKNRKKIVDAQAVKTAIETKIHRMDRSRDLYYEDINRDFILIQTSSTAIGQLNCLSVVRVGNFSYGHPTRVTAKVRAGTGKFIDIQREVDLAGAIHSKAGLTLTNYIADHYCQDHLFSMDASISLEQIYGMTDGDSASIAELLALLSAISKVPLRQSLAVTGSLTQHGEIQAIGGVNEKIEGYFDICKARGLDGTHGVIIPFINSENLMLKDEIIEAAKKGKFLIYGVKTIDEVIVLLTNLSPASFNAKVIKRLKEFSEYRKNKNGVNA